MQHGANGSNGTGNGTLLHTGDPHVQEVVKTAHEELRQLMRQRAEIMKRIGTLKQTISGLANLFGDEILGEDLLELVDRKSWRTPTGVHESVSHGSDGSGEAAGGAGGLRTDSRTPSQHLSSSQRSAGLGDYCPQPAGGIRRSIKRGPRKWPAGLAVGIGSSSRRTA